MDKKQDFEQRGSWLIHSLKVLECLHGYVKGLMEQYPEVIRINDRELFDELIQRHPDETVIAFATSESFYVYDPNCERSDHLFDLEEAFVAVGFHEMSNFLKAAHGNLILFKADEEVRNVATL